MRNKRKVIIIGLGVAIFVLVIMIGISPIMKRKIKENVVEEAKSDINIDQTAVVTDRETSIQLGVYSLIIGEGAELNGSDIMINKGGTYNLSGSLFDGTIYIDTNDEVTLNLNNVNITSSKEAINIKGALSTKINITGENNLVVNSDCALKSAGEIIIDGEGKLIAAANKMGIVSAVGLIINSGTVITFGMADYAPAQKSLQNAFVFKFSNEIIKDANISLVNDKGRIVTSTKLPINCTTIMISNADIAVNEEYNLLRNNVEKLKINELDSFNVNEVVNSYGI